MMQSGLYWTIVILLSSSLLIGCSSAPKPTPHLEGDGQASPISTPTGRSPVTRSTSYFFDRDGQVLLIQNTEVPPGWQLSRTNSEPLIDEVMGDWGIVYEPVPDRLYTQNTITQGITVFKQKETAISQFKKLHQYVLSLTNQIAKSEGLPQGKFEPPQKYSYRSPIADDFKVIYYPEKVVGGPVVGYNYEVLARYGNVIMDFITVVEDEEQTGIKAGEASVLPWTEVERLLKLIDEKFQREGF